jgi:polyisoprenyl-phosphate glycosyltransferase
MNEWTLPTQIESEWDRTNPVSKPSEIVVCIPVFKDWDCAVNLIGQLDKLGADLGKPLRVVLVDDGSCEDSPAKISQELYSVSRVEVLELRRNVGHQRAIALGLAYICADCISSAEFIVVMDADGEDSPGDIKTLVETCRRFDYSRIIFAKRRKRTERIMFRACYVAYRTLHFILTGRGISFGNFSLIPAKLLPKVVGVSELWNHYAASIVHARLPFETVPIDRAHRMAGVSKMNFVSLVTHGMTAISVYGDTVGVRLLCFTSILTILVIISLFTVASIRLFTDFAIPGWATSAFGILAVILLNLLIMTTIFVLFVLQSRNMAGFLPVRDWHNYVASKKTIHER